MKINNGITCYEKNYARNKRREKKRIEKKAVKQTDVIDILEIVKRL